MLLAALAASGSNTSQLLGSYGAVVGSGDNMLLLSLMSKHERAQSNHAHRAALFDAQTIPGYVGTLPENAVDTDGVVSEAVVPSEAAFLPTVDVSQMSGNG